MFVLMATVAEVADVSTKIPQNSYIVRDQVPLGSCRLEAPIYVWIRFQSKFTKLRLGCQSERVRTGF